MGHITTHSWCRIYKNIAFMVEEIEAQGGSVFCPRSHSWLVVRRDSSPSPRHQTIALSLSGWVGNAVLFAFVLLQIFVPWIRWKASAEIKSWSGTTAGKSRGACSSGMVAVVTTSTGLKPRRNVRFCVSQAKQPCCCYPLSTDGETDVTLVGGHTAHEWQDPLCSLGQHVPPVRG